MKLMNSELKVIQPTEAVLDSSKSAQLFQEIKEIVNNGARTILVDLENISFIDSSGLGGLVRALKLTKEAGGRLVLCSVGDSVRLLLEITGTDKVFEIFADRSAFDKQDLKKS